MTAVTLSFEWLVRALLHSLWQAPAAATGLWLALRFIPARRANARYLADCAALLGVVFAIFVTWSALEQSPAAAAKAMEEARMPARPAGAGNAWVTAGRGGGMTQEAVAWRGDWTLVAGYGWMAGAAAMLLVRATGVWQAERFAALGRPLGAGPVRTMLEDLARGLCMPWQGRVRALVGEAYRVPATLGTLWPVVLLPAALTAQLSVEQLRLMLAHEVAHIRRHDYLANLVQQVLEALLFFNPAVWWISRQIRLEREACCDGLAARVTGSTEAAAAGLAEIAARLLPAEGAGAAMGITGSGKRHGALVDRVTRLLRPEAAPRLRVPVATFALALLVAGALLAVFRSTASLTVRAAERALTPQERVEEIAQLKKEIPENGLRALPPTTRFSGTLRTEDGAPLPQGTRLEINARAPGYVTAYRIEGKAMGADGSFSEENVFAGTLFVRATAPGYAPAFAEPVQATAEGRLPAVDLKLTAGFMGKVRVVDPAGKPMEGVTAEFGYSMMQDTPYPMTTMKLTSDAQGVMTIEHAAEHEARLEIDQPGFQFDRIPLTLKANDAVRVQLKAGVPTTGTVMDAGRGLPVAGATVRLIQRSGFADMLASALPQDKTAGVLATTDSDGRFALTDFRPGCLYTLLFEAPGHGSQMVYDVKAGQEMRVALGAAREIRVRVLADAGKMPKSILAAGEIRTSRTSIYQQDWPVPIQAEGDGSQGVAVVGEPLWGTVRIYDERRQANAIEVKPEDGGNAVVLDLRTQAVVRRAVEVQFDVPLGAVAPRGKMRIEVDKERGGRSSGSRQEWEISDARARGEVPVGAKIRYEIDAVEGYWVNPLWDALEVPAGSEPLVVKASLHMAGAIHGNVLQADGKPPEWFAASLVIVERSKDCPNVWPTYLQPFNGREDGRYLLTPIVLDCTYRVAIWHGVQYFFTDAFKPTARGGVVQEDVKLPEGITITGTIVGPDGKPRKADLSWRFKARDWDFSSGGSAAVDEQGRFTLEHVNPDAPGSYELEVAPGPDTQGLVVPFKPEAKALTLTLKGGGRL